MTMVDDDGHRITCTACQVEVVGMGERRVHYHSDLHVVNLKRKVGGLGPLTEAEFNERLEILAEKKRLEAEAEAAGTVDANGKKKTSNRQKTVCEVCHKTFSSRQSYLNHEKSRRHLESLARHEQEQDSMSDVSSSYPSAEQEQEKDWVYIEEEEENDDVDGELRRRLHAWDDSTGDRRSAFDDTVYSTPKEALAGMLKQDGFFTPYIEYLSDCAGLIKYINQKVCIGYTCVACDKTFASVEDVRRHMVDKGHQRMTSDEKLFFEEYDEFYDWSKNPSGGNDDEEEWTEISNDDEQKLLQEKEQQQQVVAVSKDELVHDGRPRGRLNLGDDEEDEADDGNGEEAYAMALGPKVIGHRSLVRYYKQSGGTHMDMRDAVVASRSDAEMRVAAWKTEKKRMDKVQRKGQAFASHRRQYFELSVGSANYYIRKSKLRQDLTVLNSGYRA